MGSNASASVDAIVNTPSENSGQPEGSKVIQFHRVPCKQTSDRPQNQRLSNIFQGLIAQQLASKDTDSKLQDGKNMPSGENKRKRAETVEDDETETSSAKRTRSGTPRSSPKSPSKTNAHADGAAQPILITDGREYDPARDRDHYIVKDRLIGFLYDMPGWGPDRTVTPLSESYPVIDDQFYDDDEELLFSMDDLFDFDRYYAS